MPPRPFIGRIFDDVLKSVLAEENYGDRHIFDRNVFQKFVALMFVNYATTDPVFYGTNKADYGVSADKDMDQTPLYVAVGKALRLLERQRQQELQGQGESPQEAPSAAADAPELSPTDQLVLARLLPICDTARILVTLDNGRARECGEYILREVHHLFTDLQEIGVMSSGAPSPVEQDYRDE